jgi:hypothetical protein
MPIDRASLETLRDLIADASLTLETSPDLPQNRTPIAVKVWPLRLSFPRTFSNSTV